MGRKSQALALAEEQKKNIARPERLFHEINLLHLEGHYFAFDPKVANVFLDPMKSIGKRLQNPKINEEQPIEIVPHPGYGKPSVFAYKVYQAILKKLSDYGYPAPETVSFGSREIMRLSGRSWYGAANAKELVKTLNQFKHTAINCWFYDKGTKTGASLSLSLINKFLYTYKGRGSISYFTIWLDPWLTKSINNHYTFCLNFARIENLESIGIALYKHLYFHFSNLYSKSHSKNIVFRKDYAEICRTWLGGLKVLRYRSKILQEQLGRHLEALKKVQLIKSYAIEKNTDGNGFNLICHPGPGFFEDYDRFYSRRMQAELPFTLATDENTIQKPQEIALYFHQQLHGSADTGEEFGFSEKETLFASSLLEKHSVEETKAFIDYGLAEARKTNFDIRSIGGLKKYYALYTKELRERAKAKVRDIEERKSQENDRRRRAYEAYRATEITRLRSSLPSDELERMENAVRDELEAKNPGSKIFSGWIRQRVDHLLAEKHKIVSFEEWQKEV
jgi:Replication initiator protein A